MAEKDENQQLVQDLRDEVKILADREEQANMELQRQESQALVTGNIYDTSFNYF